MDIRKFFGGGKVPAKTAPSKTSTKKTPEATKPTAPKPKASTNEKNKEVKKPTKSADIVVIDSDTDDAPIKVKQGNRKKKEETRDKEDLKLEEKRAKAKANESKAPIAGTSPSEKENKKLEKESEKEQKKSSKKNSKSLDSPAEKPSKEKKTPTNKTETSEEKKTGKRKSLKKVESSDEEEEIHTTKRKGASSGRKGAIIFDSGSDDELVPPTPQEVKKTKRKKYSNFVSDSDDEDKQISIISAFKNVTKTSPKKSKSPPEKAKKKSCSLTDFFGASPSVHRVERKVVPVKRKAESSPQKTFADDDMEIHDDDDFEQTLLQLDTSQEEQQSKRPKIETSDAPSLASKLSTKLKKVDETRVAETPEKRKSLVTSETPTKTKKTPEKKTPPKTSPAKTTKSPVRTTTKSPVKTTTKSPVQKTTKSPVKITKSPVQIKTSPKRDVKKSQDADNVRESEGTTPKGGRGGPGYRSYLQRAPPQALGTKEIPEGAPNCLEGLTFVISGVLESLERDEAKSLVERYGGKVTTSLSKRTSFIVLGRDAGISKTAKAEELGTKQLDEDGLLSLIKTKPGKKSKYEINAEAEASKTATPKTKTGRVSKTPVASPASRPSFSASPSTPRPASSGVSRTPVSASPGASRTPVAASPAAVQTEDGSSLMWVDKYKPTSLKQVIGQQGPKSNSNKLLNWLRNWHRWQAEGRKPAFNNRFSDDGAGYRAALLSGPPGVGKTTTATLVCQEMGFSYVELNASDTRSKKSLETEVGELLGNHTLVDFFSDTRGHDKATEGKQHCLIMDEVDGMAGNEDRGGMQELIALIKKSRIPIICMCNDRNHQKVRSLANYCFDLRFQRPRVEQIKAAMMSLAYKEGVRIPPPALNEVISAANQDIRQVIHNLSMWTAADKNPSHDQLKKDAAKATKDMKMGPFDVCRKVFVGGEETAKMTINDKSDLFFHDYSFGPLFVHENYIHAQPYAARGDKKKHLQCISRAIDSIADGDLVDRKIRGNQNWSLLPLQAMYASVIPGEMMRGGFNHMVQFPQWLGKNSSTNKTDRILQELHTHMSLKLSGDRRALNMDYVPHFRRCLTRPLAEKQAEGVPDVLSVLHEYDLLREDYDNIVDISQWSNLRDPLAGIESKTKAAFTRTYNKEAHLTPYAAVVTTKKRRGGGGAGGGEDLLDEEDAAVLATEDAASDEDVSADAMIKPAKKPKGKAAASSESSKGKGRGKGQAAGRGRGQGRGQGRGRGRGRGK